ncbi:signal peptide peptidase SppA [Caviibacter abscessus]|uniref:signal peptide peptidase SppA n=1 Tax=Caviibacter abscessus TaxID=1766719 RepID=UPI00082DF653|nr:signal peptide peptidase SppA [Caviibacter abscessus]
MKKIINTLKSFIFFNIKIFYSISIGFIFFLFLVFLIIAGIKNIFSPDITVNKNYTHLIFNLKNVNEDKFNNQFSFDQKDSSFIQVINELEKIRLNDNVKDIILQLDEIDANASQIEELISVFKDLKKSNKKIYAYGIDINAKAYKLASIADKIIMPNTYSASLDITGYYANTLYYKNLLDKFGVKVESIHVGSHKSAGENLYLNKMSKEHRSDVTRIYENRLIEFANTIAENRKLNRFILRQNILDGKYANINPFKARDLSLIDDIKNWDNFLVDNGIKKDKTEYFSNILAQENSKSQSTNKNTIAVIPLEGIITPTNSRINTFYISEQIVKEKLDEAKKLPNLKGVILRINSPGGSALESELIYQQLKKFKQTLKIPIYISMGDTAASGGYYISSVGDKIFADKATITGSIGVVSIIPKFANTLNKLKISSQVVSNGKFAGIFDPYYTLTKEDKEHIYNTSLNVYEEFKMRVKEGRKLKEEQLEPIAGGRIWLGNEAINIGLVDNIGGIKDTINAITKDYGIRNYSVTEINSSMDIQKLFDQTKKYVFSQNPLNLGKEYFDLLFFNDNAMKPLYFVFGIENPKY